MNTTLTADVSRHKCLVYDGDPSEQLPVVVPLLTHGLETGWRCLYLGSPEMVRMVSDALAARSIDVDAAIRRGALQLSSDRSHLAGGFQPRAMVAMLCGAIDAAVRDGYRGLCATGDMRWELGDDENFERLLEYEALLEQVFRDKPLMGICQYHRATVPARAVQDALVAHRSVYMGSELNHDNLFYIPPEIVLEGRDHWGEWMCRQITRILHAERQRDDALRKLEATNQGLESQVKARTSELEAANVELEAFSYSVSHDLRAPLRAIEGFARMLVEDQAPMLDSEGRRRLDCVIDGAHRMQRLIDDLLEFSRASRAPLHGVELDMKALAASVVDELQPKAKVTVSELPPTRGDRALLKQVLTNLISNAAKYSSKRADAAIEIGGRRSEGGTTYWVKDNGAGFDMAYASKLFGVFQRLHTQAEFDGTGVGLALVKRIIERHGGRVWAEGAVGRGATFSFELPPGK